MRPAARDQNNTGGAVRDCGEVNDNIGAAAERGDRVGVADIGGKDELAARGRFEFPALNVLAAVIVSADTVFALMVPPLTNTRLPPAPMLPAPAIVLLTLLNVAPLAAETIWLLALGDSETLPPPLSTTVPEMARFVERALPNADITPRLPMRPASASVPPSLISTIEPDAIVAPLSVAKPASISPPASVCSLPPKIAAPPSS